MDQFLKKHKLPQLTQYEIHNLYNPITVKEIKFIILKFSKKSLGSHGFTREFYQVFKKELTTILHSQLIFMKLLLLWYQNQRKTFKKRTLYTNIPYEYRPKIS